GRDGKKSYAVLLYREKELKELEEQIETQFPSENEIKTVYQSLMNYLQLPAGNGRETYIEFDLRDFIKKFPLDLHTVVSSMKILEQEEIIGYNEVVFQPATIQFTTSKKYLFEFEQTYPQSENIIKTLLRTYEGIFDFPVAVSERMIASLAKSDEARVKEQLLFLHKSGIIEYNPQKDKPQIYCFTDRVRTEELKINLKNLESRKKVYKERIEKMISFVTDTKNCRASIIADYFGEKGSKPCNVCDNCLKKKSAALTETEFVDIHMRLLKLLQRPLHSKDLIKNLYGIRKEKAWEVIDLLQAENKIEVDADGWIKKV
ncbi:MAG TPA: RecQ family zinc-binding domain-containing protein, partial [Chitinophagaceae bacterium]|nr:RecQ family zinc-binding domain-containing protein [Chitinophagaceae bacterium]